MISESNLARQPGEQQQQQPERGETCETRAWAVDPFDAPVQDMMSAPLPLAAPVQRLRGDLFDCWPEDALLEHSLGLGFQGCLRDLGRAHARTRAFLGSEAWPTSRGLGSFSCQEMVSETRRGPDGKVHTERFASSAVGDVPTRAQEVQQAYANSLTGTEKASLERQLEGLGYKEVDERNRLSGERRRTDRYLGNWEEQGADFEKQWQARAVPALPRHLGGGARQLLSGACAPLELRSGAPRADAAPAAISAQ